MTYERRLPVNYSFGVLSNAAAISDTTISSVRFAASVPDGLSTTVYVPITLQDPSTGNFEIVWANSHAAASNDITVLRGREGTTARAWGSGTLWTCSPTVRDGILPVANRAALPADPHVGLRALLLDEQVIVEWNLTGWQTMPLGLAGGKKVTGGNNLGAAVSTAEAAITNMDSGTVTLLPLRTYEIKVKYQAKGTATGEYFLLRLREGATAGVSGNEVAQFVHDTKASTLFLTDEFTAWYETSTAVESKVFTLTAAQITGTGTLQFKGGGSGTANVVGVRVYDRGPSQKLTVVAS